MALKLLNSVETVEIVFQSGERHMHVHRMPVDLNLSDLYAAEAARKAAEARKAADVRRKLLRAGAGLGEDDVHFGNLMVNQEDEHSGQDNDAGDASHSAASFARSDKRQKAADEQPAEPLSIWA